jgi:hypothetical protein
MRFAVDAHIGDGIEPDLRGGTRSAPIRAGDFLNVADVRLNTTLLIGARHIAGGDCKTVMARKIDVARLNTGAA